MTEDEQCREISRLFDKALRQARITLKCAERVAISNPLYNQALQVKLDQCNTALAEARAKLRA